MKRHRQFNLIEIILTVAVIAFGVTVILGMLPKGLSATRAAGMESYASEVIDQMAGFLYQNGASGIPAAATAGASTDANVVPNYTGLLKYLNLAVVASPESTYFERTGTPGVFKVKGANGVYAIVMGDTYVESDGETENRVDFSGMLRVWRESSVTGSVVTLDDVQIDASGTRWADTFPKFSNFSAQEGALPGIVRVCMELSYPLSLEYDQRTRRYYSFEVKQ